MECNEQIKSNGKSKLIRNLKTLSLVGCFYFFAYNSFGQISFGGQPYTLQHEVAQEDLNSTHLVELPGVNMDKVLKQDRMEQETKAVPPRFGVPFDQSIDVIQEGTRIMPQEDVELVILRIKSPEATTLNFLFDEFHLVEGDQLFIYNADKSQVLGAFDYRSNRKDQAFATGLIKGEEAIFELIKSTKIASSAQAKTKLKISRVVHGYKNFNASRGLGTSGACNNNVICPEADGWRDDIRASAMILLGNGTRWCSGSMINNSRRDGKPYFLTANHCLTGSVSSWVFMFNYDSPYCDSLVDGNLSQTLQGAQLVSSSDSSDFALLLLDDLPPKDYNVYYSGWSRENVKKDSVVGIHHPDGDVKKISFDYDSVVHSGYYEPGDKYWEVLDWDDGTTEPGSSGSPLFDKNHRIIGQLHGGDANCSNDDQDYYGKIWSSWDDSEEPTARLQNWLNPKDDLLVLDGEDFNVPQDSIDVAISYSDNFEFSCDELLFPEVVIRNLGADTLNSVVIHYEVAGVQDSVRWTGQLPCLNQTIIVLDTIQLVSGDNDFMAYIGTVNDSIVDSVTVNDTVRRTFRSGTVLDLNVVSDFFGWQNAVIVENDEGQRLYARSGFPDLESTSERFCLVNDCYKVTITDAEGDGMCCNWGAGLVSLVLDGNAILAQGNFMDSIVVDICTTDSTDTFSVYISNIEENLLGEKIDFIPNPANDFVMVNLSPRHTGKNIEVYNMSGKLIRSEEVVGTKTVIDVSGLENGVYLMKLTNSDLTPTKVVVLR